MTDPDNVAVIDEKIEEIKTPNEPSWQELWAKRVVLTNEQELSLQELVNASINAGHGHLTVSASTATCLAIVEWAKNKGISGRYSDTPLDADVTFEFQQPQHRTLAILRWDKQ